MFRRQVAIGVGLLTATGLLAACSSVATNSASGSAPVAGANRAPAAARADGFIAGSPGPALQGITIGVPPTAYRRSCRPGCSPGRPVRRGPRRAGERWPRLALGVPRH